MSTSQGPHNSQLVQCIFHKPSGFPCLSRKTLKKKAGGVEFRSTPGSVHHACVGRGRGRPGAPACSQRLGAGRGHLACLCARHGGRGDAPSPGRSGSQAPSHRTWAQLSRFPAWLPQVPWLCSGTSQTQCEFKSPTRPDWRGQRRGRSAVIVQGPGRGWAGLSAA